MTEAPGAQTQAAKAAARKRPARPRAGSKEFQDKVDAVKADEPKAEAPQPESVEAKANEALTEMGWPAPTPEQWAVAQETADEQSMREWAEALAKSPGVQVIPEQPTVHELWCRVMDSVRSVAKGDFNEDQGFRFRGIDSVVDAVGPALRTHHVHIRPRRILEHSATEYQSKRGARMVNRVVRVEWEVTGPQGDSFLGESMGEAADMGDKSLSKAQSVAYRTYLLQALNIPTGERDADGDAHERATPAAQEGYYWDQQQDRPNTRQRGAQPQQRPSQEQDGQGVRHQAQAGEENQAAPVDNAEARKEMWRVAKGLGWEWGPLAARFKSDHGMSSDQADAQTIEAFTEVLCREAEDEEDRAKAVAQEVLGANEIQPDEAQQGGIL